MQARNVQPPSYAGRVSWMALLAPVLFAPLNEANNLWEAPCEKDILKAVKRTAMEFYLFEEPPPIHSAAIIRRIGFRHGFYIDSVIDAVEHIDWSWRKPLKRKLWQNWRGRGVYLKVTSRRFTSKRNITGLLTILATKEMSLFCIHNQRKGRGITFEF
jgi:hypothetical protein